MIADDGSVHVDWTGNVPGQGQIGIFCKYRSIVTDRGGLSIAKYDQQVDTKERTFFSQYNVAFESS